MFGYEEELQNKINELQKELNELKKEKTDLEIIKEAFTKIGLFYVVKKTSENWIYLFLCKESEKQELESMSIGDIRRYKNNKAFWEFDEKERLASY